MGNNFSATPGSGGLIKTIQDANDGAHWQEVRIYPAPITQLGAQHLTMAGAAQTATIPTGTTMIRLAAEGGDLRWTTTSTASSTSGGYLPQGAIEWLNLPDTAALSIYGASGAYANLVYAH